MAAVGAELRIHGLDEGDGPLVVLIHDVPWSTSESLRPLVRALSSRFRAVAPDLPGLGRSDKPLHGLGWTEIADELARWLQREAAGPCALVGQGRGLEIGLAAVPPGRVRAVAEVGAARPGPWSADVRRSLASRGTRATVARIARGHGRAAVAERAAAHCDAPRRAFARRVETLGDPLLSFLGRLLVS